MTIVKADTPGIERAARYIAQGGLVAFPTETVYGLGADASNELAVAGIYSVKGRPVFNPLIIHLARAEAAGALAMVTPLAETLMKAFWPGPMTLVLERRDNGLIAPLALAGLDTIAIRVPSHPVARAMIERAGVPVAAPSANRSGRVSATTAEHVAADFGETVPLVLDGGPTTIGVESTIIDARGLAAIILRRGSITAHDIEQATGVKVGTSLHNTDQSRVTAPGQLASHYAPRARVKLDATEVEPGEALLAFGPDVLRHDGPMLNLSARGDVVEAAVNLFAHLRALDRPGIETISVMTIPPTGLGDAIRDRLQRAAAPRF